MKRAAAALIAFAAACTPTGNAPTAMGAAGNPAAGSSAVGGVPGIEQTRAGSAAAGRSSAGSGGAIAGFGGTLGVGGMMTDAGDTGAAGTPELPACDPEHAAACPRGMYLSLWADHNGQNVFADETAPHLHILGDPEKETPVLDFIAAHGITSLSLYDLFPILTDASRTTALHSFLEKARSRGVREVLAICDTTQTAWDRIATEQEQSKTFDGLVTEIEFWTDNSFATFTSTLTYVRDLRMKSRNGDSMPIASYVGWPTADQTKAMAPLVDGLFVHAYVTSPDKAFAYTKERLLDLAAANTAQGTHVEVRPIFSAEGSAWAAGAEHFMGDWLATHTPQEAEAQVLAAWSAEPPGSLPPFGGFQYFEYFYLERYLN